MSDYEWPGNIRELENTIERLTIVCQEEIITKDDISRLIGNKIQSNCEFYKIIPLKEATDQIETKLLIQAYKKYKTTRKIAKVLDIDQSTAAKKLKKLKEQFLI
ncbi:MAG: TyrR/PhhR family helix-turn-helix DNA-binding protein [Bacillota bacterium]